MTTNLIPSKMTKLCKCGHKKDHHLRAADSTDLFCMECDCKI